MSWECERAANSWDAAAAVSQERKRKWRLKAHSRWLIGQPLPVAVSKQLRAKCDTGAVSLSIRARANNRRARGGPSSILFIQPARVGVEFPVGELKRNEPLNRTLAGSPGLFRLSTPCVGPKQVANLLRGLIITCASRQSVQINQRYVLASKQIGFGGQGIWLSVFLVSPRPGPESTSNYLAEKSARSGRVLMRFSARIGLDRIGVRAAKFNN